MADTADVAGDAPPEQEAAEEAFGEPGEGQEEADETVAEIEEEQKPKVTVVSSATQVRQRLVEMKEAGEKREPPMRRVDPKTGRLEILSSADSLLQWVPNFDWGHLAVWAHMPIFRLRLFTDRSTYFDHDRAYVEHDFPEGVDLESAILWWRKRVNQECKGFAVFEGGFDTTGAVVLTDPPRVMVDAATGETQADSSEEIERKRQAHNKRRKQTERWTKKDIPEELRNKIAAAEQIIKDKKRNGQEYMLRGGWVGKDVSGDVDMKRHNEIHKKYG